MRRRVSKRRNGVMRIRNTNLPLGNKCLVKLPFYQQFILLGDNSTASVYTGEYVANGLNQLTIPKDGFIDNRASKFLINQFQYYRVKGMKYTIQIMDIEAPNNPAASVDPTALVFVPNLPGEFPSIANRGQIGYLKQLPGFRMRLMSHRFARAYTKLSGYVSVSKMYGRTITDDNFFGSVNILGTDWVNPLNVVNFRWGVINLNESAIDPGHRFQGYIKCEYLCEFMSPSIDGVE